MSDGFIKSESWTGARSCPYCAHYSTTGHRSDCPWSKLSAEVADLKARLKAVRGLGPVLVGTVDDRDLFRAATNLRVKNWRKP